MRDRRIEALVATLTGLLVPTPGLGHVGTVETIDPDDARLECLRGLVRLAQIFGPNAGRKTVDRVVRHFDRLVEVRNGNDRGDRTKYFLLRNDHFAVHAGEQRGFDVATVLK